MTKRKKKWLIGLVVLFVSLFFGLAVHADNGSLVVDDSQINQIGSSSASNKSIGYQEAPYLFLEGTQSSQQSIDKKSKQILSEAQQQSFTKNKTTDSTKKLDLTPINQKLFTKSYVATPVVGNSSQTQAPSPMPLWVMIVIIVVIMLVAAGLGIVLGRKFSKIFVKKGGSDGL